MRWIQRVNMALRALFQRRSATKRLSAELQFHIEQQTAEFEASGMALDEARAAALRSFGNPTVLRDEARETWSWYWLEKFWRDVRYGARTLRRSPGFSLMAVLVMALGIGATTALFTIVQNVLLKPLPFRDPGKLVMVYEHFREGDTPYNVVSPADFLEWKQQTHGFQDMAAWRWYGYNLTGADGQLPEAVQAAGGSSNLFSVLGVPLALGRTFTQAEDQLGGHRVVILTWSLYQRRFDGNPSAIGKQIRLDANLYTIVGVLPRWFTYPDAQIQLWVPYAQTFTPEVYARHDDHQSHVVARLKPGVSAAAATQQVSALQYRIHLAHASEPVAEDAVSMPMIKDVVKDAKTPLLVLMGAVACMLLIACLNVSNLLVARGAARRKEVAVRGALGGSRLTLIREQMTESMLLCAAGGALGLLLSIFATRWLASHWQDLPRAESIHVDGAVMAFTLGLVFCTALLAGLLPAISSTGKDVFATLQEGSRAIGGSLSRARLRQVMLTIEIALTVVLLVAAGLLFRSFLNMRGTNVGCVTDNVLTLQYDLPAKQYDTPAKLIAFHEALLEKVRHLPGVLGAGLVSTAPGGGWRGDNVFTIPDNPRETSYQLEDDALIRTADPGYFSAMQIPMLQGRTFSDDERLNNNRYIIISKKFADQFFAGQNPIGQTVRVELSVKPEDYKIVGVVGDTLYNVAKPVKAAMYFPLFSGIPGVADFATLMVHTAGNPLAMSLPIQKVVASLDATLPVANVRTMQQVIGQSTNTASFGATLLLAFAGLSLLLAAVGLYGVLSYLVTQRFTEIGIRIALGAQRGEVLRLVLLDGLGPVLWGLVLGFAGGVGAGEIIRSLLYHTQALDGLVIAGMMGSLLVAATVACLVPALRALKIDPVQALRTQ
ncbi:MAG TPA: ABC transporter permease [Acidobacteriaceae bacterium]|nr:ABC transporter permease [Acidobacteriaceae bacterium]